MTLLDPDDLRRFARRDWGALEAATRASRGAQSPAQKSRLAVELYEAARATCPGWPDDATRRDDLANHERVCALLAKAAHVGAR